MFSFFFFFIRQRSPWAELPKWFYKDIKSTEEVAWEGRGSERERRDNRIKKMIVFGPLRDVQFSHQDCSIFAKTSYGDIWSMAWLVRQCYRASETAKTAHTGAHLLLLWSWVIIISDSLWVFGTDAELRQWMDQNQMTRSCCLCTRQNLWLEKCSCYHVTIELGVCVC